MVEVYDDLTVVTAGMKMETDYADCVYFGSPLCGLIWQHRRPQIIMGMDH